MIPKKYAHILFSIILSAIMSFIISGVATFKAVGLEPHFFGVWMGSWLASWLVAFPSVTLIAPLAKRLVMFLVTK